MRYKYRYNFVEIYYYHYSNCVKVYNDISVKNILISRRVNEK